MKNLYAGLALFIVSFCATVHGQALLKGQYPSNISAKEVAAKYIWRGDDHSRAVEGRWLDYWFVEDSIGQELNYTNGLFYATLFPDSSVTTSGDRPRVHLIGNVLDPNSQDMQTYLGY